VRTTKHTHTMDVLCVYRDTMSRERSACARGRGQRVRMSGCVPLYIDTLSALLSRGYFFIYLDSEKGEISFVIVTLLIFLPHSQGGGR